MPMPKAGSNVTPINFDSPLQDITSPNEVRQIKKFDEFLAQFQKGITDRIRQNSVPCCTSFCGQRTLF